MFTKSKIKSIRPIGQGEVWDITVAEDESYLAQGFVNHNSREPNVQNWSPRFREMVIARPDHVLINSDAGSFEFRAAAARSGEEYLIETFEKRHELLQPVLEIAKKFNYSDPDEVVKAEAKNLINCTLGERELLHEFSNWDIHRRNGALIFDCQPYEITPPQRQVSKCVALDSIIFTNKGFISLRDLLPKRLKAGEFYPVKGLKVLTDTGFKDAPKVYYAGELDSLIITTASGRRIQCSPEHKFRTFKNGKYVWAKASSLVPDQELFITFSQLPTIKYKEQDFKNAEDWGSYLRHLIPGDVLCLSKDNPLVETIKIDRKNNIFQVVNPLNIEEGLPDFLLNGDPQVFRNFLKNALFTNGALSYIIAPEKMLRQIQLKLQTLDINSFLELNPKRNVSGQTELHFGALNQSLLETFLNEGTVLKTKIFDNVLAHFLGRARAPLTISTKMRAKEILTSNEESFLEFLATNNLGKDRIVNIEKGEPVVMGDVHVPENNTVVYNGIVSHNTLGYCVAPNTKILTPQGWVSGESLEVFNTVIGFDEYSNIHGRRYLKPSTVQAKEYDTLEGYKLVLEDGSTLMCSKEHMWLTKNNSIPTWIETQYLQVGSRIIKFTDPESDEYTKWNQDLIVTDKDSNFSYGKNVKIIHKEYLGKIPVVKLQTSTRTFIAEGFASHNCLLYGGGPPKVQLSLLKDGFHYSLKDCIEFQERFFANLSKIKEMISNIQKEILTKGYITSFMGRRRHFAFPPKYQTRAYKDACAKFLREATNAPFQMSNADATKLAIVRLEPYFRSFDNPPAVILNIHDELLVEAHKDLADIVAPKVNQIFTEACYDSLDRRVKVECSLTIRERWGK